MSIAISIQQLSKSFGAKKVLGPVDLQIEAGEIYALLGSNGSGKSTLLRILAGALRATSGAATLSGRAGYVPQNFALYPDLRVEENLQFVAQCLGSSKPRIGEQVEAVLARVGLAEFRRERTAHLSHGWKQRLALAAALIDEPPIVLLDEATAGIDPVARLDLWSLLRDCASSGAAILLSTHHTDEADRADRVGFLSKGILVKSTDRWSVSDFAGVAGHDAS
jgi:ABC-2 type transport system ATP-binding protein